MKPEEIDALRKDAKIKMIRLDLDGRKRGALSFLALQLSARTGKRISRQTLSMALTGFRSTPSYQIILQELDAMLAECCQLTIRE
jgi:hypothetical protein